MKVKTIAFALVAVLAAAAHADKVTLKSGSFLTGKAGAIDGDSLEFESEDIGTVKIKVANIARLESDREHVVRYNDLTTESKALTVADGKYMDGDRPLDMSNVKDIDAAEEKWHGAVNVAYMSSRGNTYNNNASVLANVSRRWEKDRFNASFGYYYSETGTSKKDRETSSNRLEAEAQHDHFWTASVYHYENARYDRDRIAGLDYRLRLGVGIGYQWLEGFNHDLTGKWSFNQELGVAWVKTGYLDEDPDAENSYATLRYAHHLNWLPKWSPTVECFHNFEYLPDVADFDIYLMKADAGFTTKVLLDFDLLCKVEWDYDSMPSRGRKSSDVRYIVGLGYKW